jgi:hypothetical protein
MATAGDHLLWRSMGDIVYVLNIEDGRYAGLSGREAQRWVRRFGSARTTRSPASRLPARPPAWWRLSRHGLAWHVNRQVRRLLGQRRFPELYALAERATARPAPASAVAAAIDTFLRTELLFRNNNPDRDCLVRSFSLYLYLLWLGFRVTHQIGIVPYPFDAHAWVELDGKPVLERVSSMDRWHVISKLGQQSEQFAAMP